MTTTGPFDEREAASSKIRAVPFQRFERGGHSSGGEAARSTIRTTGLFDDAGGRLFAGHGVLELFAVTGL